MAFTTAIILLMALTPKLMAHGSDYEILKKGVMGVRMYFHSGVPLGDARVLIFAPGETKKYQETRSDRRGIVTFSPDRTGTWILQVREKSGHGMRINLPVKEGMIPEKTENTGSLSSLQKTVMALSIIWGLVGTALFFSRKGKN